MGRSIGHEVVHSVQSIVTGEVANLGIKVNSENRPHKKLGIAFIALGSANLVFGFTTVLESTLGALIGGILDKLVCLFMIGVGYYLFRKKIISTGESITLIGLIDGKSKIEIPVNELEGVGFNNLKQKTEIRTTSGLLYAGIADKSEAYRILSDLVSAKIEGNRPTGK